MSVLVRNLFDIEVLVIRLQAQIALGDLEAWRELVKVADSLAYLVYTQQTSKFRGHLLVESESSAASTPVAAHSAKNLPSKRAAQQSALD